MFAKPSIRIRKFEKRILDLESQLEAERRIVIIRDTEILNLAKVIARDRARIESETASFQRIKAEAEGLPDERNNHGSV